MTQRRKPPARKFCKQCGVLQPVADLANGLCPCCVDQLELPIAEVAP